MCYNKLDAMLNTIQRCMITLAFIRIIRKSVVYRSEVEISSLIIADTISIDFPCPVASCPIHNLYLLGYQRTLNLEPNALY